MIRLGRGQQRRLVAAARQAYPCEACGLMFAPPGGTRLRLVPTSSTWNTPRTFRIKARDVDRLSSKWEFRGEELVGCYHSHVLSGPSPSPADAEGARNLGGLWLIYSVRSGRTALFRWTGQDFEQQPLQLL